MMTNEHHHRLQEAINLIAEFVFYSPEYNNNSTLSAIADVLINVANVDLSKYYDDE